MNKTYLHAKKELEILSLTMPDAIIMDFEIEILALCEKFGKSGQSGFSAPYIANQLSSSIKKLLLQETVAPLMGEDSEWCDISERNNGETLFQNNRESGIFKVGKDGKAYYINAIIFDGDIGGSFMGDEAVTLKDGNNIGSSQYIKSFPFTPKSFHVDVIDCRWKDKEQKNLDINGDWWTHSIKDEEQLKEVFEYYDMMR